MSLKSSRHIGHKSSSARLKHLVQNFILLFTSDKVDAKSETKEFEECNKYSTNLEAVLGPIPGSLTKWSINF